MKKYYRDCYGCRAKITEKGDGSCRLSITTPGGHRVVNKTYKSFKAARIALGRYGDGFFREVA